MIISTRQFQNFDIRKDKRRWLQINKAAKWSKKSKYVQFPEIIKSGFYSIKHLDLTRRERNMFYKSRLAFNGINKKIK